MDGPGQSLPPSVKWDRRRVWKGHLDRMTSGSPPSSRVHPAAWDQRDWTGDTSPLIVRSRAVWEPAGLICPKWDAQRDTIWLSKPHPLSKPQSSALLSGGRHVARRLLPRGLKRNFSQRQQWFYKERNTVKAVFQTAVFLYRLPTWLCISFEQLWDLEHQSLHPQYGGKYHYRYLTLLSYVYNWGHLSAVRTGGNESPSLPVCPVRAQ